MPFRVHHGMFVTCSIVALTQKPTSFGRLPRTDSKPGCLHTDQERCAGVRHCRQVCLYRSAEQCPTCRRHQEAPEAEAEEPASAVAALGAQCAQHEPGRAAPACSRNATAHRAGRLPDGWSHQPAATCAGDPTSPGDPTAPDAAAVVSVRPACHVVHHAAGPEAAAGVPLQGWLCRQSGRPFMTGACSVAALLPTPQGLTHHGMALHELPLHDKRCLTGLAI